MRISDWSSDVCSSDLSSQRQKDVYAIPREFGIRCGERGFRAGKRALDIQHFQARYHAAPGKPRLQPRRLAASISRSAQPPILVAVMGLLRGCALAPLKRPSTPCPRTLAASPQAETRCVG